MISTKKMIDELDSGCQPPVSFAHHPGHIKSAIKASGLKPAANQSHQNCQRCVALQEIVELKYAEGVVTSDLGYPIAHAWVVDADGKDHDLTRKKMSKVICKKVYDKHQVRQKILDTGDYEQMDAEWCNFMLNAAHMKLPMDLPYDRICEMLDPLRGMED